MFHSWKSYFRGEVCGSEAFVLAKQFGAGPASPDIDCSYDLALVYEVDHPVVDYVMQVSFQETDPRKVSEYPC